MLNNPMNDEDFDSNDNQIDKAKDCLLDAKQIMETYLAAPSKGGELQRAEAHKMAYEWLGNLFPEEHAQVLIIEVTGGVAEVTQNPPRHVRAVACSGSNPTRGATMPHYIQTKRLKPRGYYLHRVLILIAGAAMAASYWHSVQP